MKISLPQSCQPLPIVCHLTNLHKTSCVSLPFVQHYYHSQLINLGIDLSEHYTKIATGRLSERKGA